VAAVIRHDFFGHIALADDGIADLPMAEGNRLALEGRDLGEQAGGVAFISTRWGLCVLSLRHPPWIVEKSWRPSGDRSHQPGKGHGDPDTPQADQPGHSGMPAAHVRSEHPGDCPSGAVHRQIRPLFSSKRFFCSSKAIERYRSALCVLIFIIE